MTLLRGRCKPALFLAFLKEKSDPDAQMQKDLSREFASCDKPFCKFNRIVTVF